MAILIALYEDEKSRLQSLIKECLEDFEGPDFLLASYHQKALFKVDNTLRRLNNYEDKYYDEKQYNLRLISNFKNGLESANSEYMGKYFEEQLNRYQKKQDELNSKTNYEQTKNDDIVLDKALTDLVFNRIKKFRFYLNNSKNCLLEFSIKGGIIKLKIQIKTKDGLYDSELDLLSKLGFYITNKKNSFIQIENNGEETLLKLKSLLIRLIFDIFYFYRNTDEGSIEF